jgi:exoribonuclease R
VVRTADDWAVRVRRRTDVDAWNAEVSLLTGMAAAQLMLGAGVGLLRTLPPAEPEALEAFVATARALGIQVPPRRHAVRGAGRPRSRSAGVDRGDA